MGFGSIVGKIATAAIPALIGGGFSAYGQAQANQATQASTQTQMDFQERMRATQYQTAMADMKKAGMNPMLAYQQGGAGALSGSSYQASNELAPLAAGIESGTSSAIAVRRQNADLKQIEASTRAIDEGILKTKQDRHTAGSQEHLNNRVAEHEKARMNLTDILGSMAHLNRRIREYDLNSAKASDAQAKTDLKINQSTAGRVLRWIDKAGQSINPFSSAVSKQRR